MSMPNHQRPAPGVEPSGAPVELHSRLRGVELHSRLRGNDEQSERLERPRRGITLLEVVLAVALLAGAVAVLGHLTALGHRAAVESSDLTRAQLLCQSLVDEIVAGSIPAESVNDQPFPTTIADPEQMWRYRIEIDPADIEATTPENVAVLRVTVTQAIAGSRKPLSFSLVRWLADPNLQIPTDQADMGEQGEQGGES